MFNSTKIILYFTFLVRNIDFMSELKKTEIFFHTTLNIFIFDGSNHK